MTTFLVIAAIVFVLYCCGKAGAPKEKRKKKYTATYNGLGGPQGVFLGAIVGLILAAIIMFFVVGGFGGYNFSANWNMQTLMHQGY